MKADADQLVLDLQAVQIQKAAAIAAINDDVGSSCNEDFEIKANTMVTNCSSFIVDECESPKPSVSFNCGDFTITSDGGTVTVGNGTATITLAGSTLTISGVTSLDLPAGTTVGGSSILTSLPNHTHTAGTYVDGAGDAVTGTSGNPS